MSVSLSFSVSLTLVATVLEDPVAPGHAVCSEERHAAFLCPSLTHAVLTGLSENQTCHLGLISAVKCLVKLDTHIHTCTHTRTHSHSDIHTPRHACHLHELTDVSVQSLTLRNTALSAVLGVDPPVDAT